MTLPSPFPLSPILPRRQYIGSDDIPRVLTEDELQEYLEDTSDIQSTYTLWDKTSGLPGLLKTKLQTEVRQQAYKPVETYFDLATGVWRYVKSNYRVPASRVRLGVLRMSKAMQTEMRELTAQLVNGSVTREYWYKTMREMMKNEYRASWLASIGGSANYTRSEVSRFGWAMRKHYRYLNNFLDEILSGKQPLNGRAIVRAGMYARAANAIYQNNLLAVAIRSGMREAMRELGPNESHCHDSRTRPGCVELADKGWMPIAEMTEIGDATCISNCLCSLRFRR